MIETRGLTKIYTAGTIRTSALNGVNLSVREGEFLAVMGPSGSGKSTLLNVLGFIDVPTSGAYTFLGAETAALEERARASLRKQYIGFVFQNFNLIEELTVFENIELPLMYRRVPAAERKRRVGGLLERLSLAPFRDSFPRFLSGGQQQRAAVARAAASMPRLILADEPTGNLDSAQGTEVMLILRELNEDGAAVVMVTHSAEYAGYGHRTIRLLDGRVVSEYLPGAGSVDASSDIGMP